MILKEVFNSVDKYEIVNELISYYHSEDGGTEEDLAAQAEWYLGVFDQILNTEARYEAIGSSGEKHPMRIVLNHVKETYGEHTDDYISVDGCNGITCGESEDYRNFNIDDDQKNKEVHYSLSLTGWHCWLAMEIDVDTLKDYSLNEIAFHCLEEMTFYGSEEEMQESRKELLERFKETEKAIESGDMSRFIPMDEVFDQVREKMDKKAQKELRDLQEQLEFITDPAKTKIILDKIKSLNDLRDELNNSIEE